MVELLLKLVLVLPFHNCLLLDKETAYNHIKKHVFLKVYVISGCITNMFTDTVVASYLIRQHFPHSIGNNRYSCVCSLANQPVYASLSEDHGLFVRTGQNGENRNCGSAASLQSTNNWEGIRQTDVTI